MQPLHKDLPRFHKKQIQSFGYIHQIGIVMVDKDCRISFLAEEVIQLSFSLDYTFKRTESFQVSFTDIGYNAIIRFGYSQRNLISP